MRGIVRSSLQLRYLVLILAAALMAFGISQIRTTPVDVLPEFDPPLVEIQTEALGLSAAEVESLITVPMEADLLNGVAWLERIYSESVAGMSSILLVFEPGTDPIAARQMVQERLTQAHALPNVSTPPVMLQPLSATSRVMMVGISSEQLSLIDLGVLARWTIKPRLIGVPGVANVAIWGQRERQMQVQVDPSELAAKGVSLNQVIESTGEALWVSPLSFLESSSPGTAGWIDTPNQRLSIRHTLPIRTTADLERVPLVGSEGLTLGDVATVVEDHQPLIGDARVQDSPGLIMVIQKFPGANTLEVTRDVEEALAVMAPGLTGVEIDTTIFHPAVYVKGALDNLGMALLAGAVLAVIALGACFFSWRTTLVSMVAIPLALLTAIGVLTLGGATLNVIVLAGLAVALCAVIDDAVVSVEQIARRLREQAEAAEPHSAAATILTATLELSRPLMFATLISLLAVLPIFFFEGLAGMFFRPFVLTYVVALVAAAVVALSVTPALCLVLFPRVELARSSSPLVGWLKGAYSRVLERFVRAGYPALLVGAVLAIGGLVLLPALTRQAPLPAFRQTDMLIQWEGAPGTSGAEMNRVIEQASRELEGIQGVRNVGSHVGRAITGDTVVGINGGELWISLDPAADYNATVAAVREVIDGYPGIFRTVRAYEPERLNETLSGGTQNLIVRVYGTELPQLNAKAEEVRQKIAGIAGVVAARADVVTDEPQVEIEVDLAAAERYQIKPGDVRREVTTLLSGIYVGNLFEDQKVFDVVVWGKPEIRDSLSDLNSLLIETPGGPVRLDELAEVRIVPAPTVIRRDTVSRFVDVIAQVEGRQLAAVGADAWAAIATVSFPLESHAEVVGDSIERQAAGWRTLAQIIAVLIGIFLILQAALNSWRLALLAFLGVLPALAGGVVAGVLAGGALFAVLCGLLAVFALAIRNSLALLNSYQQLQQHDGLAFGPELAVRGALERFAPIVTSVLAAALALVPVLFLGPIAGLELLYPLGIVVLGGLATTLVQNLFILPALYLRFGVTAEPEWSPQLAVAGTTD